jgi:hypothetical protein
MASPYNTQAVVGAVNTMTITGIPGRALRLLDLVISVSAQPAWLTSPNVQVQDGTTPIWQVDLPPSGSAGFLSRVPLPTGDVSTNTADQGLVGGPGNNLVIVVANPGAGVKTIINAKVAAQ